MDPWFDDPEVYRRLPLPYRLRALYLRLAADRTTGHASGATWLLRVAGGLTRRLDLRSTAEVQADRLQVALDLRDERAWRVLDEIRQPSAGARILEAAVDRGDSFVDLGANHGSFALRMARRVGTTGRVLAMEPQPRLAALLRRSGALNGFDWLTVLELACGAANGDVTFTVPGRQSGRGSVFASLAADAGSSQVTVGVARLDDIAEAHVLPGRLAIKMDIEGSEVAALAGGAGLLRVRRPLLLFEWNPESLAAAGCTAGDLAAALGAGGYDGFSEVESYPALRPFADLGGPQRDLFAVHRLDD